MLQEQVFLCLLMTIIRQYHKNSVFKLIYPNTLLPQGHYNANLNPKSWIRTFFTLIS